LHSLHQLGSRKPRPKDYGDAVPHCIRLEMPDIVVSNEQRQSKNFRYVAQLHEQYRDRPWSAGIPSDCGG
jgi:hypothetical protein